MKKRTLIPAVCLLLCLLLAGCGSTDAPVQDVQNETPAPEVAVPETNDTADEPAVELAEPVMEWWELYNPNGFDTVTAVISNPNNAAIDVSYDLVYYKGGEEVARSEYFTNFGILPGGRDIIWANYDIPASTDVDDVKMENVTVSEAYDTPIDGTYEYVGTTDGEAFFDFTFDSKPELATITFLLYNDENGNSQCDKGEIVVTSIASLMEQTGRVSFETTGYSFTDYEVFFAAYE